MLYYHYNGHGDVVALTDDSQEVVATYSYDAWGNVLSSTAKTDLAKVNPYGYAGYTYDTETQLYYLMARYYQPAQGVFLSLDPDPGDEDNPLTMNGYAYADNNPVTKVDPDGHFAIAVGFGIYISAKFIGTVVVMGIGAGIGYYAAKKRPYNIKKKNTKPVPARGVRGYRGKNKTKTQIKNGRTHQKRIYGRNGQPRTDIDYSNHGNAKRHPNVPHKHSWKNGQRGRQSSKLPKNNRKYNNRRRR
ncbi:RHS repeat-associated core domain-containing protein [Enterococcus sp. AD013-P3]|uniref:RHS repeat-associated core domain-containing protein n=1 Tax=Enterococcus sp. AD013-P3 TaxID=3411036 RepID=UPI003B953F2F